MVTPLHEAGTWQHLFNSSLFLLHWACSFFTIFRPSSHMHQDIDDCQYYMQAVSFRRCLTQHIFLKDFESFQTISPRCTYQFSNNSFKHAFDEYNTSQVRIQTCANRTIQFPFMLFFLRPRSLIWINHANNWQNNVYSILSEGQIAKH